MLLFNEKYFSHTFPCGNSVVLNGRNVGRFPVSMFGFSARVSYQSCVFFISFLCLCLYPAMWKGGNVFVPWLKHTSYELDHVSRIHS